MGKTPIMNPKTILSNSTLALVNMAAKVENKPTERVSQDTVEQIDDALSMAEKVSFFGTTTKTYRNPADPQSGLFCTVPVKYDFKDRDTRARVEQLLRSKCKVNCSIPYPPILRACIKKAVESGKKVRPDHFVRVNVDPNKMVLKLSWKAPGSTQWEHHHSVIPIPDEALDITSKTVPESLVLSNLPLPRPPDLKITSSPP